MAKVTLTHTQRLLRLFALGDVFDHRDKVLRGTGFVTYQADREVDPDVRAVFPYVTFFHGVGLDLARQHLPDVVKVSVQVVWVRDVLEGKGEKFLALIADDLTKPFIHTHPASVQADLRDADCGLLEGGAEPFLAIA